MQNSNQHNALRVPYGPPIEEALRRGDVQALSELLASVHSSLDVLSAADDAQLAKVSDKLSKSQYETILNAVKLIQGTLSQIPR